MADRTSSPEVWEMKTAVDHMVKVTWTDDQGWHPPTMSPIASCLHYATQCFEGMKVYRGYDGKLRLFRPDKNCARLVTSSARALMKIDGPKWLPKSRPGTFLYLRPAIIGNGEQIGVVSPSEVLMFIVAVGWPDFKATKPGTERKAPGLKLLASKSDVRLVALVLLKSGRIMDVTEAGASNFFVVWKTKESKTELVTAPLGAKVIFEGVTRGSVLELAKQRLASGSKYLTSDMKELEVIEREFPMLEIEDAWKEGRLIEAFLSGTAYFITPVSAINFRDQEIDIPMGDGTGGAYAALLKKWLKDIMYGNVDHEWGVVIEE